jgi:predicted lactoylglutathione lyase
MLVLGCADLCVFIFCCCFCCLLQRKTMKKVLQELTGSATSNDKLLIALSAVTKMFVGELVATGEPHQCEGWQL